MRAKEKITFYAGNIAIAGIATVAAIFIIGIGSAWVVSYYASRTKRKISNLLIFNPTT